MKKNKNKKKGINIHSIFNFPIYKLKQYKIKKTDILASVVNFNYKSKKHIKAKLI